ncbi:MAG: ATP-dependent Clp protease adaptor ClpS [Polyangiaceae bacterium]
MKGASGANPPGPPKGPKQDEETIVEERTKPVVPRRYRVIFHNDDYTTMEFVIECLIRFFRKTETEATHVMLTVHKSGSAVAGVYTREVAETKVEETMDYARESGMPLMLTAEPE